LIEELEYEAKSNKGKRTDLTFGPDGTQVKNTEPIYNDEVVENKNMY